MTEKLSITCKKYTYILHCPVWSTERRHGFPILTHSYAMSGKRVVELVRVHDTGVLNDSERQVNRDVKDVFPITSKKQVVEDAKEKGLLDVKTFVSATSGTDHARDHNEKSMAPIDTRPLAEILMEQKEQKQAEFEAGWKTMKTGKNRPLDEDEVTFLNQIVDTEAKKHLEIQKKEEEELQAFRKAQNQGAEEGNKPVEPTGKAKRQHASLHGSSKKPSKILKSIKVVKLDEEQDALNLLGSYGSDSE